MPVAICIVIPHSKKAETYFIVLFERFETSIDWFIDWYQGNWSGRSLDIVNINEAKLCQ